MYREDKSEGSFEKKKKKARRMNDGNITTRSSLILALCLSLFPVCAYTLFVRGWFKIVWNVKFEIFFSRLPIGLSVLPPKLNIKRTSYRGSSGINITVRMAPARRRRVVMTTRSQRCHCETSIDRLNTLPSWGNLGLWTKENAFWITWLMENRNNNFFSMRFKCTTVFIGRSVNPFDLNESAILTFRLPWVISSVDWLVDTNEI